mmetsp:Transcript_8879/g.29354  ORF Transcript_8879/g.29354 Transcript_8879/m.29354 type:complete len:204 (-) Transcript_8879:2049-2660(-)
MWPTSLRTSRSSRQPCLRQTAATAACGRSTHVAPPPLLLGSSRRATANPPPALPPSRRSCYASNPASICSRCGASKPCIATPTVCTRPCHSPLVREPSTSTGRGRISAPSPAPLRPSPSCPTRETPSRRAPTQRTLTSRRPMHLIPAAYLIAGSDSAAAVRGSTCLVPPAPPLRTTTLVQMHTTDRRPSRARALAPHRLLLST